MINRYFSQYDELDKDQNNQHGDFNIYPQCVELGKDDEDEDSKKELEDNYCEKKGISTSQGDELGRSVRVPRVPRHDPWLDDEGGY